jgi:hypothetical protein
VEPALAIFGPLIGQCFVATIAPNVTDRHCFESVYERAHVRDTHVVTANGKDVYSGETIYSFDGRGLDFTYFNSNGGVGHGTASVAGDLLSFAGSMKPSPDKAAVPMKGYWRISEAGFEVENEGQPKLSFSLSR